MSEMQVSVAAVARETHSRWTACRGFTKRDPRYAVYSPTLTAVLDSSSEALLPPADLPCMLMRLLLLGAGRTMALIGRAGSVPGDAGGELAITAKRDWGRGALISSRSRSNQST